MELRSIGVRVHERGAIDAGSLAGLPAWFSVNDPTANGGASTTGLRSGDDIVGMPTGGDETCHKTTPARRGRALFAAGTGVFVYKLGGIRIRKQQCSCSRRR